MLVGHSGVGKSTLVNRLVPEAERAVGAVSAIGRGRHTSTSAVALRLPALPGAADDPGWIVDTPGVRSFGLAHVSAESLLHGFPDLVEATVDCPANCPHTVDEADCALDAWVADGRADPAPAGLVPPVAGLPGRRARPRASPSESRATRVARATRAAKPTRADARSEPGAGPAGRCLATVAGMTGYADDLALAHRLADAADALSTARFRALDLRVESKPDLTPVSDADTAVEREIRALLAAQRPGDGLLGEEYGATPAAGRAAVGGGPDRRHQELRAGRTDLGHPDRTAGRRPAGRRAGLRAGAGPTLVGARTAPARTPAPTPPGASRSGSPGYASWPTPASATPRWTGWEQAGRLERCSS